MTRRSWTRFFAAVCLLGLAEASAELVHFNDPNMHQAVWEGLGRTGPAAPLDHAEMNGVGLTVLDASNRGITDLTGLNHAHDLVDLDLFGNALEDIGPLERLNKLVRLNLGSNFIEDLRPLSDLNLLEELDLTSNGETITPRWLSDLGPISGLRRLEVLNLSYNRVIEDLAPIQGLTNLRELDLGLNRVRDIGPLFSLRSLEVLELHFNDIKNLSVLSRLTNLQQLNLAFNEFQSIDALISNPGLTAGDTIILAGNPLNKPARDKLNQITANVIGDSVTFPVSPSSFEDVLLDRSVTVPDQLAMALFDYNVDGNVDVSDFMRYLDSPGNVTVPRLVNSASPKSILDAESLLANAGLLLGRIDVAQVFRTPPVQIVAQGAAQDSVLPYGSFVNVTASIPPDALEFLQLADFPHAPEDRLSAISYYAAIDPDNRKDTLEKFLAENGADQPGSVEAFAVYFNGFDLGFGRQMHMRQNDERTIFWVPNHDTVDDAWQSQKNPFATVAMEYSPGPSGGAPFVKYYAYDKNNQRLLKVNLDGRGEKFLPNVCLACHGGTPKKLYDDIEGGNIGARFIAFDTDTYVYSEKNAQFSRESQEEEFKKMNRAVLDSLYGMQEDHGDEVTAAIELIEGWYGGAGLPGDFDHDFVPTGWQGTEGESVYRSVVARTCRACHVQQPSFQFGSFAAFNAVKDTVRERIFEEGRMPKAGRTYRRFWMDTHQDDLNEFATLVGAPINSGPGAPLARILRKGGTLLPNEPVTIDASESLFGDEFQWSFSSDGVVTTIDDPTAETTFFTPPIAGDYTIQLVVSSGSDQSEMEEQLVRVGTVPDYDDVLTAIASCIDCHNTSTQAGGLILNQFDVTKNYQAIVSRSILDPVADVPLSPFLRKGAGLDAHEGGVQTGWNLSGSVSERQHYDTVFAYLSDGADAPDSNVPTPPTFNELEAMLTEAEADTDSTFGSSRTCLPCHGSGSYSGTDFLLNPSTRRTSLLSYIDLNVAENSLLLRKASGQTSHSGGTIAGFNLSGDRIKYDKVLAWIQEGAPDRGPGETIPATFTQVESIISTYGCSVTGCHDANHDPDLTDATVPSPRGLDMSSTSTRWGEIVTEMAANDELAEESYRVNFFDPESSLIYRKPQNDPSLLISHGGGTIISPTTEPGPTDLATILSWIDDGAMDN